MLDRCSEHHQPAMAAAASTTFSLFFPLPKVQSLPDEDDHSSITTSPSSPSSSTTAGSVVDCTLSLWTPSSRRAAADHQSAADQLTNKHAVPPARPSVSRDDVGAADHQSSYYYRRQQLLQGGNKPATNKGCAAHDAFVDRRCANCGTSSTPLWRNGPRGPKSLCNACGIRFKKEERRAAATAAMESDVVAQRAQYEYGATAAAVARAEGAFPCGAGAGGDADASAPFLAWRLNVVAPPAPVPAFAAVWPERTGLFQYN